MRADFFKVVEESAETDENIYLLTADLGFVLFDDFKARHPERFFNIGVAEANMIGVGAGLALSGKNVFCYSIIPFLLMRAYEQIRVDVAYHNLDVKLVGVGGGFTYGLEGFTHFGLEDFALMRLLPNMTVVSPADIVEAKCLASISLEHKGPMYIRLGRSGEPTVHTNIPDFKIGQAMMLQEGKDLAIFAVGSMVSVAKQVVSMLEKVGLKPSLVNMHTIKPLDVKTISNIASAHDAIFSMEEHYVNGGLGSSIAEVLAEAGYAGRFNRIGIPGQLRGHIGTADYLREQYGLSPERVYERILTVMRGT